jgi:polyphosphate glucokinase
VNILTVDIGGTKLKVLASQASEPRKAPSGKDLRPSRMVEIVRELAEDWDYEAVSVGYPGLAGDSGPRSEPDNLGSGWVGFNFAAAFDRPVKVINDAAMQALGSYEGGRMLFLGLGTGLGSALISEHVLVSMELGRILRADGKTLGNRLGRRGLKRLGESAWCEAVLTTAANLMDAFAVDYVVLGGGNAKHLKDLPHGIRLGHPLTAFRGGFRLWGMEEIQSLSADGERPETPPTEWRLI